MGAQNAPFFEHQADQFGTYATGLLGLQGRTADKPAVGRFHGQGPGHVRDQRRVCFVDILAI
ncbi:hypothetical protein D3C86_1864910 [compost metagenome]